VSLTETDLLMRPTGVGASESPMLVGVSPFGGPIDLYMRKVGLWTEPETDAQLLGNLLEDGIAQWYALTTGASLEQGATMRHPEHPWFLATPDRFVNGREKLLEVKLVGKWMEHHWSDGEEGLPDYVATQVQHQMEVCDVDCCDVVALLGGTTPRIYQVTRDREIGAGLLDIVRAFWFDHVVPRVPPPIDSGEASRALLAKLFPFHRTPAIAADVVFEELARSYRNARRDLNDAETRKSLAENLMKERLGDAEAVRGADWTATWKANAKGVRSFRFSDRLEGVLKGKAA